MKLHHRSWSILKTFIGLLLGCLFIGGCASAQTVWHWSGCPPHPTLRSEVLASGLNISRGAFENACQALRQQERKTGIVAIIALADSKRFPRVHARAQKVYDTYRGDAVLLRVESTDIRIDFGLPDALIMSSDARADIRLDVLKQFSAHQHEEGLRRAVFHTRMLAGGKYIAWSRSRSTVQRDAANIGAGFAVRVVLEILILALRSR